MKEIDSDDGKTLFQEITDFEECSGDNSTSTFFFFLLRFQVSFMTTHYFL